MQRKAKITFYGGVDSVTGANFLVEVCDKKILVDCGMFQGDGENEKRNRDEFPYNPTEIDILFVTHAHADHIGCIPKLVREGFVGAIYSTRPTMELAEIMFQDGLEIVTAESRELGLEPPYSESDCKKALSLWKEISYHNAVPICEGVSVIPYDAGHILGSAMYKFVVGDKNVLFTGDLGNSPDLLLPDTEKMEDIDYLIIDSVYGDRVHPERAERVSKFEKVIEKTIHEKGVLIIPSFALERSQNILYILNNLIEEKHVPHIPVYFDSPLSIDITEVFKKNAEFFNDEVRDKLKKDPDVFSFPGLLETYSREESKSIFNKPNPKIILASAGMSQAGRIIFHEKYYLDDPKATILFVGYQAVGTLGRMIQDGLKNLNILGQDIQVKARVETIEAYSAHRDVNGSLDFIESSAERLKKVFCVMGEKKSSFFLVQKIKDNFGIDAESPEVGDSFEVGF